MFNFRVLSLSLALVISGCAPAPTYDEVLFARPVPQTQTDITNECRWLRGEIARQQATMNNYSGQSSSSQHGINLGAIYAQVAPGRIASLESRASEVGCRSAFTNTANAQPSEIQQCISACKTNTAPSSKACFNTCNK